MTGVITDEQAKARAKADYEQHHHAPWEEAGIGAQFEYIARAKKVLFAESIRPAKTETTEPVRRGMKQSEVITRVIAVAETMTDRVIAVEGTVDQLADTIADLIGDHVEKSIMPLRLEIAELRGRLAEIKEKKG